jgi:ribonuclease HI
MLTLATNSKGLRSGQNRANQHLYQKIYKIAEAIQSKGIITHIHWVPGHLGIYGNEKADSNEIKRKSRRDFSTKDFRGGMLSKLYDIALLI